MAILGIDFGLKRIGIAFSDEGNTVAFPGTVVTGGEKELTERIVSEAKAHNVTEIVVGLPRNMNGTEGEMSFRATKFAETLREVVSAKIVMWDERLTSVQADRAMLSGDLSRKKRKKRIDSMAAQLMLQSYLDFLSKARTETHTNDDPA